MKHSTLSRRRTSLVGAVVLLAASLSLPTSGHAVSFDLTSDNCTGGCGTAPFGTVDVTQNGANVNFVVHLANGLSWANTGAADFQLFKFNGTGVALTDIIVTQLFAGHTLQVNTGAFNADGTGNFNFGISCATCGNGDLGITSTIAFTIANATIADVTAPNALLNVFVADVRGLTGNVGPVSASLSINSPPVANAGPNQSFDIVSGSTVHLDGTASHDDNTPTASL